MSQPAGTEVAPEVFDDLAYAYDGTLEGLLSAIFEAYLNKEDPQDVVPEGAMQPRLSQRVHTVRTHMENAMRVKNGLIRKGGWSAFSAVRKASCSSDIAAGTVAYRFVRYSMDSHKGRQKPFSNISHPDVAPLFDITRSVNQECEHMRQFIRFEHLKGEGMDLWFARCNPRDSVVPLVMDHFAERFNVQPFVIYDENHHISGVYEGNDWYLVRASEDEIPGLAHIGRSAEEATMQDAWRRFYKSVSIDARYNPELRRHFMAKRFWKNITEMREDLSISNSLRPSNS